MTEMIFRNRAQGGELLAATLTKYANRRDVIVLGLPRGGVPVAAAVAKKLHAPLDVMIVRKLGLPGWEELAMGAIASGGIRVINERVVREAGISPTSIETAAAREGEELKRRELAYRGHAGPPDVEGKIVILCDDGIATGSTIRAAVRALRQQHPARIVIAVPTASADTCEMLEPLVDELISLVRPLYFRSVGQWYDHFEQTTDAEVTQLLREADSQWFG